MSEGLLFFLLATAIAFGIPAVEQSKWNLRRWIYSAAAIVCLLAIPAWSILERVVPSVTKAVGSLSSNPSAWFTLVMVLFIVSLAPFGSLFGKRDRERANTTGVPTISIPELRRDLEQSISALRDDLTKRMEILGERISALVLIEKQKPQTAERKQELEWKTPLEILTIFSPSLNEKIKQAMDELGEFDRKAAEDAASRSSSKNKDGMNLLLETYGYSQQADKARKPFRDRLDNLLIRRLNDLRSALEHGQFIAQAFVTPDLPLTFQPAAIRASAVDTPFGAG